MHGKKIVLSWVIRKRMIYEKQSLLYEQEWTYQEWTWQKKKNKKPQKSSTHDEKAILIGKGRNVTCAGNIYTNSSLEAGHTG